MPSLQVELPEDEQHDPAVRPEKLSDIPAANRRILSLAQIMEHQFQEQDYMGVVELADEMHMLAIRIRLVMSIRTQFPDLYR